MEARKRVLEKEKQMTPRFEARWSNGCWKLFDTHTYSAVNVTSEIGVPYFDTQKAAQGAADWCNTQ